MVLKYSNILLLFFGKLLALAFSQSKTATKNYFLISQLKILNIALNQFLSLSFIIHFSKQSGASRNDTSGTILSLILKK